MRKFLKLTSIVAVMACLLSSMAIFAATPEDVCAKPSTSAAAVSLEDTAVYKSAPALSAVPASYAGFSGITAASYAYSPGINAYIEPFAYTDTYYFYYIYYNDPATYTNDRIDSIMCYNYNAGQWVTDAFVCDGTYTYYVQYDGTAMFNRLTYHPDGEHIIYFNNYGHEVFDNFSNVYKSIAGDSVNDVCYFNTYGYMYVDFLTYDVTGTHLYYANPYGVVERFGLFQFSNGDTGYANSDGKLEHDKFIRIIETNYVYYFQSNGHAARGTTISDGVYSYTLSDGDGHVISTNNPYLSFAA